MTQQDPVMTRIVEATELGRSGERTRAREAFWELWAQVGADGDAFHRCTLAHFMADVQDDPHQELTWDLRALEAADELTDERAQQYDASLTVRGLYPSLHLSLADDYHKLGNLDRAREHLASARNHLDALDDGEYGTWIRANAERISNQLDDHTTSG